ncbi:hypothetical protein BRX37_16670 [Sphingomonas sp. S-NIH.Pt3_0716]|nr:hypothetical protein BRX37_16670 [Sphingomonas sp. S-NIH.Pt3_0716]
MTKKSATNSLKAVLDRASAPEAPAAAAPSAADDRATPQPARKRGGRSAATGTSTVTPARQGTKMIGGHFAPEVSTRLRLLAVEEDTTVQALLEEAINDLLTKKAGRKPR